MKIKNIIVATVFVAILALTSFATVKTPQLGAFNTMSCPMFNLTFGISGHVDGPDPDGHAGGAIFQVWSGDWSTFCFQTTTIKGGTNNGFYSFPVNTFYSDIANVNYCFHIGYRHDNYVYNGCQIWYDPGPPDHMWTNQNFGVR